MCKRLYLSPLKLLGQISSNMLHLWTSSPKHIMTLYPVITTEISGVNKLYELFRKKSIHVTGPWKGKLTKLFFHVWLTQKTAVWNVWAHDGHAQSATNTVHTRCAELKIQDVFWGHCFFSLYLYIFYENFPKNWDPIMWNSFSAFVSFRMNPWVQSLIQSYHSSNI